MIKKLRLKFIIINMTIVTILLSIILGMVYYFTEMQLENRSIGMMQNIALNPLTLKSSLKHREEGEVRLPYFAVQLSPDGKRISMGGGYYDLSDEEILDDLVRITEESNKKLGVIPKYNMRYCKVDKPRAKFIVYADMSSEKATLESLTATCFFIGAAGFILFLLASISLSKKAVRPVDEALKSQRQFIADASHELKTPLTVIMTNAQILESKDHEESIKERAADNIMTVSHEMKNLIEEMLTLAKTEKEDSCTKFENVNFSKVCSDAVLPFEPLFFEQGLNLVLDIEEGIFVLGNKDKLQEVVTIFLDNAQKYSYKNSEVRVALKTKGSRKCRLSVSDEGDEIPKEALTRIFERFYRLEEARTDAGSFGLGLSIAKNIADEHKAKIYASSQNKINTFYFEINKIN